MPKYLVIVESPAKSKTIENYLGPDYIVTSSKGHIRDLTTRGLGGYGVDIEDNFKPQYKIMKDKHVIEALGKTEVVIENGEVTSVGEPLVDYCPIFDKIDAEAFVKGYIYLSNENKDKVFLYVGYRYQNIQNDQQLRRNLCVEIETLEAIEKKLKERLTHLELIDKLQVERFILMIDNAIVELKK